jgi:multidrug efflux system outer membrane protein
MKRFPAWVTAAAVMLAACVSPPPLDRPVLLQSAPLAKPEPCCVTDTAWPARQWWKAMNDAQLDALIEQALRTAPDLQVAQARITAAHAATGLNRASTGLQAAASADVSRQRLSDDGLISAGLIGFHWYNQDDADLRLSWDLDFWGRERARIEASVDRERATQAERQAAELVVVASLTLAYLDWQTAAAQLEVTRNWLDNLIARQALQTQRIAAGIDAPETLDALDLAVAQIAESRSQVAQLQDQHRLAIAALTGLAPDALPELQARPFRLDDALLPADAAIGLIARRPDIVAERWRVEAALEDVRQARAGYYPDVSLNALAGLSSIQLSKLFNAANLVPSFGAAVYLPIFDIRNVRARHGVSRAQLELAVAEYNASIVTAAQEVSAQMSTLHYLDERCQALDSRIGVLERLDAIATAQGSQGLTDARSENEAHAEILSARIDAMRLQAEKSLANLRLIKALGGGVAIDPAPPETNGTDEKLR